MAIKPDMAVSNLTPNEARAIVLSLRTLLSFGPKTRLDFKHLERIAYAKDEATKAFHMALETR